MYLSTKEDTRFIQTWEMIENESYVVLLLLLGMLEMFSCQSFTVQALELLAESNSLVHRNAVGCPQWLLWAFWGQAFCFPLVTFPFLRHTRCEFMEWILIEKVLIRYLLFLCVMKFCSTTKNSSPQRQFGFKVISACSKARQWSSVRSWEGQPKELVRFWGCQSLRLRKSLYSKFLFQVKDLWETG